MKKIILSLIAIMACMSISAQVVKVYQNGVLSATYTNSSSNNVEVVFEEAEIPALLPGKFSVSTGKQVQFTRGNMYWDGSNYKLEKKQTDYPTSWDASHIGNFFWTKTAAASYAASYSDGSCTSSDKFFCGEDSKISAEGTDNLYALSSTEWNYLVTLRTNAKALYKNNVTVTNGAKTYIRCFILAPDDYTGTLKSSYTLDEIYAENLVCLPSAGYRYDTGVAGGNDLGLYYSATPYGSSYAYYLYFQDNTLQTNGNYKRSRGCSVRLVAEAEKAAEAKTGEAAVSSSAGISGNKVQWVQLWAGGPKWAVQNVGAKAVGEDGGSYTWGGVIDADPAENPYYCTSENDIAGTDDDTATKLWGSNWRMPTSSELADLMNFSMNNYTASTWTAHYEGCVSDGLTISGKDDYADCSIFLPGVYECTYSEGSDYYCYWSSTPRGDAGFFYGFNSSLTGIFRGSGQSAKGFCVRAVLNE